MQEVGEGIPRMYRGMELSGLRPPEFDQDRLHFYVALRNTPVYDTETMRFLEGFRDRELNDLQVRALACQSFRIARKRLFRIGTACPDPVSTWWGASSE